MVSGSRLAVVALVGLAACTHRLHPVELVPAATGSGEVTARVVSVASTSGYRGYRVELSNPTGAPVEIDLAAAQLADVSMVDGASVAATVVDGGPGVSPGRVCLARTRCAPCGSGSRFHRTRGSPTSAASSCRSPRSARS